MSFYEDYSMLKFDTNKNISFMDYLIERVKEIFWLMMTALASVVAPVGDILVALFAAFVFNIFVGIATDVHVNRAKFDIKKAFNAISQLAFYGVSIIFLEFVTVRMNEPGLGATAIKWTSMIVVYFYFTNIFRNGQLLFPKSQAIKFIYELLSTEIFNRIKEMVGHKRGGSNE